MTTAERVLADMWEMWAKENQDGDNVFARHGDRIKIALSAADAAHQATGNFATSLEIAACVTLPAQPSAVRLCAFWNFITACLVLLP